MSIQPIRLDIICYSSAMSIKNGFVLRQLNKSETMKSIYCTFSLSLVSFTSQIFFIFSALLMQLYLFFPIRKMKTRKSKSRSDKMLCRLFCIAQFMTFKFTAYTSECYEIFFFFFTFLAFCDFPHRKFTENSSTFVNISC